MKKIIPKDKYNEEIKDGNIIDIKQTVNGYRYFLIVDLEKLDVRYYINSYQESNLDVFDLDFFAIIDRKYEYDVKELLDMKPGSLDLYETEIEIVGKITEEELLQIQLNSRSSLNLTQRDVQTISEAMKYPLEPSNKLKEAFMECNKKKYTEDDVSLLINKLLEYYQELTKAPIQMSVVNGFLKEQYGFFKEE